MNLVSVVLLGILVGVTWAGVSEEEGKKFIEVVNQKSLVLGQELVATEWAADTANKANQEKATKEYNYIDKKFEGYKSKIFPQMKSYPWQTFKDPVTKYMFLTVYYSYRNVLSGDKKAKYDKLVKDMTQQSSKLLLKEYKSTDNKPKLKPEDVETKASNDYKNVDEMSFYWKEYYDAIGKPLKNQFTELVALQNENARLKKYPNAAASSQIPFEIDNFESTMLGLYKQIEPLYKELHAYMRYKLWVATGKKDNIVDPKGPIPADLLGDIWGSDASSLYTLLAPYPKKPSSVEFSSQLKAKGYNSKKMAQIAENFFVSLGLSKMPEDFWAHSMFEKKPGINCSANTYDFANGKDYRLVFCADFYTYDFSAMMSYIGDLEYDIESKNQPYLFQGQQNYVFQTSLDNVIERFALSPDYLKSLGLLNSNFKVDNELLINALLSEAIGRLFVLPWIYSLESWRWNVFEGKITPQNYNCEYWKIRTNLQGIEPPVNRDENDFDVGVNTWFVTGGQYMTDYISTFLAYEMVRGLCEASGYYDPKTKPNNHILFCDVHNSKAVGAKIKSMMELGSSQPWYQLLQILTGKNKLDASATVEYFQPLFEWLQAENKKNKVTVGWNAGHNRCH